MHGRCDTCWAHYRMHTLQVLLDADGHVMLTDFGLSRVFDTPITLSGTDDASSKEVRVAHWLLAPSAAVCSPTHQLAACRGVPCRLMTL